MQKITIPTVDHQTCLMKAPESFRPFVTYDKICAGLSLFIKRLIDSLTVSFNRYADGSGVCQGKV